MYRIPDSKRIQNSANLIANAMIECLKEKTFSEVTVSDVQQTSGVSRATFYRIFDNTADVLYYQCEQLVKKVDDLYEQLPVDGPQGFLHGVLRFWLEDHVFLEALYRSQRMDILQTVMLNHARDLKMLFPNGDLPDAYMDYIAAGTVGLLSSFLMTWVKHGKQESAEELWEIFNNIMMYIPHHLCLPPVQETE